MLLRLLMLIFNSPVANIIYAFMVKKNLNNWSNVVGGRCWQQRRQHIFELRNEEINQTRRRLLGIVNATGNLASRGFFLGGILLHIMISPLLFMS